MSSKPSKKVHYSSSTKAGKSSSHERKHSPSHGHHYRSSRDSGVGSSSASDRASLNTTPNDSPFNSQEIQFQRHNPTALAEALDTANERIRELEALNVHLNIELSDSNKENRSLRKERMELEDQLDDERRTNDRLRRERENSPRALATTSANSGERRRTTPPISGGNVRTQRRQSINATDDPRRYIVPQPPLNNTPNPFTPLSERTGAQIQVPNHMVTYAPIPSSVAYAPSIVSYTNTPQFTPRPESSSKPKGSGSEKFPNDGNYHAYPV